MYKRVKCTVRVAIPVEICVYANVSVTTTAKTARSRKELAKLLATQLKLWNTGTCVDEVVQVAPFDEHIRDYRDHVENALVTQLPKKSVAVAIKLMNDDVAHGREIHFDEVP